MATKDSEAFFAGGSPSAKFDTAGTTVTGTITEEPVMQQQTTPEGKLKTWDDGAPMNQLVVNLQTTQRDPEIEDDDGIRRLYIKRQMRTAVQTALREAGAKGLDVGGTLTVTYTHDGERTNPAFSPPKQYVAQYVKPTADQAGFFGGGAVVGNATNGAAAAPQVPAAALAAGITAEAWVLLPAAAQAAFVAAAAPALPPMPPGMTADVWAGLTPEARAALSGLVK
jgi:hypothetical protein